MITRCSCSYLDVCKKLPQRLYLVQQTDLRIESVYSWQHNVLKKNPAYHVNKSFFPPVISIWKMQTAAQVSRWHHMMQHYLRWKNVNSSHLVGSFFFSFQKWVSKTCRDSLFLEPPSYNCQPFAAWTPSDTHKVERVFVSFKWLLCWFHQLNQRQPCQMSDEDGSQSRVALQPSWENFFITSILLIRLHTFMSGSSSASLQRSVWR